MGRPAGWMKELTGRSAMKSPGAPSHRREVEREFWREIAKGITTEDGTPIEGPVTGPWKGRNKPHRGDRRWVQG